MKDKLTPSVTSHKTFAIKTFPVKVLNFRSIVHFKNEISVFVIDFSFAVSLRRVRFRRRPRRDCCRPHPNDWNLWKELEKKK